MDSSKKDGIISMGDRYAPEFQQKVEKKVSRYIREYFSFTCFPVSF